MKYLEKALQVVLEVLEKRVFSKLRILRGVLERVGTIFVIEFLVPWWFFCGKETLPKTSGKSAPMSLFQTSKNLKLEGGFGDLQVALL